MKILYVTSSFPYGHGEGFLIAEVVELRRQGHDVEIVPTFPRGPLVHHDARDLLAQTTRAPVVSLPILGAALAEIVRGPRRGLASLSRLGRSRSPRILAKNLAVYPKALWLGGLVRELGAEHIHAHWGATSSTMAMVASHVCGVPWSFTAHRWDIAEDNLLGLKARDASFVRVISESGSRDLSQTVGSSFPPPVLIHMGVDLPELSALPDSARRRDERFRILVPGSFLEVKGHAYLVDALALLKRRGRRVFAGFAGDGPLRRAIERQAASTGVGDECAFLGRLSHSEVARELEQGSWDLVALASVETASGEKEGIPVALMEAMSYGIPVLGTSVGGVTELLRDGAGVVVPPRDATALADAVERLLDDPEWRRRLSVRGRSRVEEEFSVRASVAELVEQFRHAA